LVNVVNKEKGFCYCELSLIMYEKCGYLVESSDLQTLCSYSLSTDETILEAQNGLGSQIPS